MAPKRDEHATCTTCANWNETPESGVGPGSGWCALWEKVTSAQHSCTYWLSPSVLSSETDAASQAYAQAGGLDPDDDADATTATQEGDPDEDPDPNADPEDHDDTTPSPVPGLDPGPI